MLEHPLISIAEFCRNALLTHLLAADSIDSLLVGHLTSGGRLNEHVVMQSTSKLVSSDV
jgi:hypothetical protein